MEFSLTPKWKERNFCPSPGLFRGWTRLEFPRFFPQGNGYPPNSRGNIGNCPGPVWPNSGFGKVGRTFPRKGPGFNPRQMFRLFRELGRTLVGKPNSPRNGPTGPLLRFAPNPRFVLKPGNSNWSRMPGSWSSVLPPSAAWTEVMYQSARPSAPGERALDGRRGGVHFDVKTVVALVGRKIHRSQLQRVNAFAEAQRGGVTGSRLCRLRRFSKRSKPEPGTGRCAREVTP